ncbi:IS3 family transposase [Echinicola sp. 20G]|uniref:IS3 family transposase n=1 Tax=Echinicola sp. 20G TaxID=2781961 RepID=UPI00190FEF3B|nr:IS3 family transposase [Echinicola sp. 20G]
MCKVLKVISSSFYHLMSMMESKRQLKVRELSEEIRSIHKLSNCIFGSPRITAALNDKGRSISRSYVSRLMNRIGIRSKIRKKNKVTTDSTHSYSLAENLLQRDFSAKSLSQKWVGDITYIRTGTG